MEPPRIYDYLARTRRRLLESVRPLTPRQYARDLRIGRGTLARTLPHVMISEWYYVQRILGRDVPPYARWLLRQEDPRAFAALEPAWTEQADEMRATLAAVRDRDAGLGPAIGPDRGLDTVSCSIIIQPIR